MNVITANPLLRARAKELIRRHAALHDIEIVPAADRDRWVGESRQLAAEWIELCDELLVELDPGSLEEFAVRAIRHRHARVAALR